MRLVFAALLLLVAGADLVAGTADRQLDYAALVAGALLVLTVVIDRCRPAALALWRTGAP